MNKYEEKKIERQKLAQNLNEKFNEFLECDWLINFDGLFGYVPDKMTNNSMIWPLLVKKRVKYSF